MQKHRFFVIFAIIFVLSPIFLGMNSMMTTPNTPEVDPVPAGISEEPSCPFIANLDRAAYATAGKYLYYYNATLNNGSFWRVDMNATPYIPVLVFGNAGNVGGMDALQGDDGDEIYFTTDGYGKAVMKLNTTGLVYGRLADLRGDPLRVSDNVTGLLSVARNASGATFIAWSSISNNWWGLFLWNDSIWLPDSSTLLYNYSQYLFLQIGRQQDRWPVVLFGNSNHMECFNITANATIWSWDQSSDFRAAYLDDIRGQIYFSIQYNIISWAFGVYDLFYDLTQYYYNATPGRLTSIYGTPSTLYWCKDTILQKAPIVGQSGVYENISKAGISPGIIRIASWDNYTQGRAILWDNGKGLRVSALEDVNGPQQVMWVGYDLNMAATGNNWTLVWEPAWDLSPIMMYEIMVSNSSTFGWSTTIFSNSTSLFEGFRAYGDYYYKVRGVDIYGNLGSWSPVYHVQYVDPKGGSTPFVFDLGSTSAMIGMLIGAVAGFILASIIFSFRHRPPKASGEAPKKPSEAPSPDLQF